MKKVLSLLVAVCVVSSVFSVCALEYGEEYKNMPNKTYSQVFDDVPMSHWAFEYIGEMYQKKVINGYPNGKYYPENFVERCEFAKIMVCAAALDLETPFIPSFADVKNDDWFFSYVETAKNYLTGYSEGEYDYYRPNAHALREDIAVALVKLKGYDISSADISVIETMFTDYVSISVAARPYVAAAVERGLISGYEDDTFRGQQSITRAEAAAMLWRASQYGNDNKVADINNVSSVQNTGDSSFKTQHTVTESEAETEKISLPSTVTTETAKPVKKTHGVKIIAKAEIENSISDMTIDGDNNIYYIDRSDNALCKVNALTGKTQTVIPNLSKIQYIETETQTIVETKEVETQKKEETIEGNESEFDKNDADDTTVEDENEDEILYDEQIVEKEIEVEIAKYTNYMAQQIFYDSASDTVLLIGYFEEKENEMGQTGTGKYWYTLNANNTKEILSTYKFSSSRYGDYDSLPVYAMGSLNNGQIITDNNYFYNIGFLKLSSKKSTDVFSYPYEAPIVYAQTGNSLYCVTTEQIYHYDFASERFAELDLEFNISADKIGTQNGIFYFWNLRNGTINSFNARTQKFEKLDVDTINGVDLEDGGYLSAGSSEKMFVTSNENFVFYDNNSSAIRILYRK